MVSDPLGDLLIELSSTPATARWIERRRAGRTTTAAMRPRAASCSRRLMSDSPAAASGAAAALTSKSQSHTQLYRNASNCSDLGRADSSHVHLRHRSHQQLQPQPVRQHAFCACSLLIRDGTLTIYLLFEFIFQFAQHKPTRLNSNTGIESTGNSSIFFTFTINNSASYGSISLKFGTEFDHVKRDLPQTFKVKGSKSRSQSENVI